MLKKKNNIGNLFMHIEINKNQFDNLYFKK